MVIPVTSFSSYKQGFPRKRGTHFSRETMFLLILNSEINTLLAAPYRKHCDMPCSMFSAEMEIVEIFPVATFALIQSIICNTAWLMQNSGMSWILCNIEVFITLFPRFHLFWACRDTTSTIVPILSLILQFFFFTESQMCNYRGINYNHEIKLIKTLSSAISRSPFQ